MKKVYIDGQAGTTGLQIHERLAMRKDIELLEIDPALRKDENERKKLMRQADLVFLCLPDQAAKQAAHHRCEHSTSHQSKLGIWLS